MVVVSSSNSVQPSTNRGVSHQSMRHKHRSANRLVIYLGPTALHLKGIYDTLPTSEIGHAKIVLLHGMNE
jgi:hypothetical protein